MFKSIPKVERNKSLKNMKKYKRNVLKKYEKVGSNKNDYV